MGSAPDDSEFITPGFTNPEVEARYRRFLEDNRGEIDIPRLSEVMWNASGRVTLKATVQMSDLLPELWRMEQSLNRIERRVRRLSAMLEDFSRE